MNIVYKLTFEDRKQRNEKPYLYIGSKSNCTLKNGLIYDRFNNPYYGSSTWDDYDQIVEADTIKVEVIAEFEDYTSALNHESVIQKQLDVVASPLYFNKSIATVNSFSDPNYATYKHVETGKVVRLPITHIMVESGEYVGVTKGTILTEEERKKRGRSGEENPFYGKKHSEETKIKISESNSGREKSQAEIDNWVNKVAKKPKSKEHRNKIGRKGMVMLQNVNTKNIIRIPKSESLELDPKLWVNPRKLNPEKKYKCDHCGLETTASNIKRWHNENCKHRT